MISGKAKLSLPHLFFNMTAHKYVLIWKPNSYQNKCYNLLFYLTMNFSVDTTDRGVCKFVRRNILKLGLRWLFVLR